MRYLSENLTEYEGHVGASACQKKNQIGLQTAP